MNTCRHTLSCKFLVALWIAVTFTGCENGPAPLSYQEALSIHKSEVELLNSLKTRRLALSNSLAQIGAGGLGDAAAQLAGSLLAGTAETKDKVNETLGQFDGLQGLLPEEAQEATAKAASDANALSDQLTGQVKDMQQQYETEKKKIESELATLDQEIAAQEAKVARALKDKDAAEARR
ncbi:MAG: hypothetical protein O2931_04225 [Planctomycetota bacterium]|nr:hypothetical protein [Planctomycetota bacterium]MDA1177987.1 hypothetical protein [Planctomycetota bacterium]